MSLVVDTKSTGSSDRRADAGAAAADVCRDSGGRDRQPHVAAKVADKLKLAQLLEVRASSSAKRPVASGSVRDWLADQLLRQIDVRPSRESSVINYQLCGVEPAAGGAARERLRGCVHPGESGAEGRSRRAARPAGSRDRCRSCAPALEKSQEKLSAYQRESGILGAEADRLDVGECASRGAFQPARARLSGRCMRPRRGRSK